MRVLVQGLAFKSFVPGLRTRFSSLGYTVRGWVSGLVLMLRELSLEKGPTRRFMGRWAAMIGLISRIAFVPPFS